MGSSAFQMGTCTTGEEVLTEAVANFMLDSGNRINLDLLDFRAYAPTVAHGQCRCASKDAVSEDIVLLKQFGEGKVGTAYLVKSRTNGTPFILKTITGLKPVTSLQLTVSAAPTHPARDVARHLWQAVPRAIPVYLSVGMNGFATQTVLSAILHVIFEGRGIRNYTKQYEAHYCCPQSSGLCNGSTAMALSNQGDFSNFLTEHGASLSVRILANLMIQVVKSLAVLKHPDYCFMHADLKARNVFITRESDGYYVAQLADFDKSSIFWRGVRFYNHSYLANLGLSTIYSTKITEIPSVQGEYYRLPKSTWEIASVTMHNMYPMAMSYDFYTFLVSLFSEQPYYLGVFRHINLKALDLHSDSPLWHETLSIQNERPAQEIFDLWTSLWFPAELKQVTAAIQEHGRTNKPLRSIHREIATFLQPYKLRVAIPGLYVPAPVRPASERPHISLSDKMHVCTSTCQRGQCSTALGAQSCSA